LAEIAYTIRRNGAVICNIFDTSTERFVAALHNKESELRSKSSLKRNEEKKHKQILGLHESRRRKFIILINRIGAFVFRKRKMKKLAGTLQTQPTFVKEMR
jgi:hypothetical protein